MVKVFAGLDIGSVSAKLVFLAPKGFSCDQSSIRHKSLDGGELFIFEPHRVLGRPFSASGILLGELFQLLPETAQISLCLTGSQAQLVAEALNVPFLNEYKALARGIVELVPAARTILEIGGDGSKYMQVSFDRALGELNILDYNKNGECAAGTGSFIDQQALRMNYQIEEIGPLVLAADGSANIAGRCSVFAKSDMIHAQQRGYAPGAIFRGLCDAVVRNYKGTVVRGKPLIPQVVFVGGVAANQGVVNAVRKIFELDEVSLSVPEFYQHGPALGCALDAGSRPLLKEAVERLNERTYGSMIFSDAWPRLNTSRVRFENLYEPIVQVKEGLGHVRGYLGLDIGSVSTNLALIDEQGQVLDQVYTRTEGRPLQVVQREMAVWADKWGDKIEILGVGATGSGRELIGELVGADVVHDEITAHKTGACTLSQLLFNESIDTIFEIGGQDSKFISIDNGVVVDFAMNEACAAGTGSFLEEQAGKLGISIQDDFAELALGSLHPIRLGERCTVFMEKDVAVFMQQRRDIGDITAGLAFAVVYNYLNRVVRGRKIGKKIYFQGGTAYNRAVAAAFSIVLDQEIVIPPYNGVIGAVGAALLAREKYTMSPFATRFHGFDLSLVHFEKRQFICKACSNQCDIQEIMINGEHTYWGDKCSHRYRKRKKVVQRPVIPDLFAFYHQWLHENIPGPDGLGIRIGLPKSLYFWDRFPFFAAYFSQIGAEVVLSDETTQSIVAQGKELSVAEPCFPVIVGHGHFKNLLEKEVDYLFMPQIINSETELAELQSWACPWGQTLPLVIRNTALGDTVVDRLLMPVLHFRDGSEFIKSEMLPVAKILGISRKRHERAIEHAYFARDQFRNRIIQAGQDSLDLLARHHQQAIVIIGRPYNIYDAGVNLHVPQKLRDLYGINVIPLDFLPLKGIEIQQVHDNMFWNYGRRILQACTYAGRAENLHVIYFTNFKCGPDSYIKHFVHDALGAPFLSLQFDDHSNDAGILTRCEAYLQSKGLLTMNREDVYYAQQDAYVDKN